MIGTDGNPHTDVSTRPKRALFHWFEHATSCGGTHSFSLKHCKRTYEMWRASELKFTLNILSVDGGVRCDQLGVYLDVEGLQQYEAAFCIDGRHMKHDHVERVLERSMKVAMGVAMKRLNEREVLPDCIWKDLEKSLLGLDNVDEAVMRKARFWRRIGAPLMLSSDAGCGLWRGRRSS